MNIVQRVKDALRISHSRLDDEIAINISVARAELSRIGVEEAKAESDDVLIGEAITTYCLYKMAPEENQRYFEAFVYQADCLRKTGKYQAVQHE